jgi:hypothetical protein
MRNESAMVKYKLRIKRENIRKAFKDDSKRPLSFSIIDLERGSYPLNWVCKLPKDVLDMVSSSSFFELFNDKDSLHFAKELLREARKDYADQAIIQEIDLRLTKIQEYLSPLPPLNKTIPWRFTN